MTDTTTKHYFQAEAIVNYPKVRQTTFKDPKTKIERQEPQFSCALYFDKQNAAHFLKEHKQLKEKNAPVKSSLKRVKDEIDKLIKKSNDADETDQDKRNALASADILKTKLPKEYIYLQSGKGLLIFLKCYDIYKRELNIDEIKSGDKVYIKGNFAITLYEGKKHVSLFINIISKIQNNAVELYDREARDREFFDGLKQYENQQSETDNDPNNDEPATDGDDTQWE